LTPLWKTSLLALTTSGLSPPSPLAAGIPRPSGLISGFDPPLFTSSPTPPVLTLTLLLLSPLT
jgi:hypothetical protein